jgi:glutamate-1-semialdehyde aminotransferase
VRIARAFTGRDYVLSEDYHGWHDEFTSLTPPANGVPSKHGQKYIAPLKGSWLMGEGNTDGSIAAVIIEPVGTDASDERVAWLRNLRRKCTESGVMLVFDETITGLRYPSLSVAKHHGIEPDLVIMGKAIGGGYPLALVGGRRDVMEADYFVSSTFAGDCIALAAAVAVFELVNTPGVMPNLWNRATKFCDAFNAIEPGIVSIKGYGTRGVLQGGDMNKALFMQECVKAGVLFGPSFFYGTTHDQHDDETLSISRTVLNRIKNKQVELEGILPVKPFAEKVREK